MVKRLEWNRKTATFVTAVTLTIVLLVVFAPREAKIAEDKTLELITWSFQRPDAQRQDQHIIINKRLESSYSDGGLSVTFRVEICDYISRAATIPYDELRIAFDLNATVNNIAGGFISSIQVVAHKDKQTTIDWQETDIYVQNLSVADIEHGNLESQRAYIKFEGKNNPQSVYAKTHALWDFLTPNSESHQLKIMIEIIYYDGIAYKKVVQPFQLNIIGSRRA